MDEIYFERLTGYRKITQAYCCSPPIEQMILIDDYYFYDNNYKFWFNEKHFFHRLDGPAIEWQDGEMWFINGQEYYFDDWLSVVDISTENKILMKLKHG